GDRRQAHRSPFQARSEEDGQAGHRAADCRRGAEETEAQTQFCRGCAPGATQYQRTSQAEGASAEAEAGCHRCYCQRRQACGRSSGGGQAQGEASRRAEAAACQGQGRQLQEEGSASWPEAQTSVISLSINVVSSSQTV